MHVSLSHCIKGACCPQSCILFFFFCSFLHDIILVCLPGKMKIKMAAKAPSICITTPMLGIKIASTRVMVNQIADTVILRAFSCAAICSSVSLHTVFHRQSKAALKSPRLAPGLEYLYSRFSFLF